MEALSVVFLVVVSEPYDLVLQGREVKFLCHLTFQLL